jgi:hypothetical protein
MPDITIVKLKIRRGTDTQRQSVILEQGELGYTIDTQRVFVGNGVTLGGTAVGSVVHPPLEIPGGRLNQSDAVTGDIVYENSVLWQLSGSLYSNAADWANISPKGDGVYIAPNGSNQLTIKDSSITPNKLASTIVYNQGGISSNASGLSANVDGTYLTIASNKITLNSVNENVIPSSALGRGLSGGSGNKIVFNGNTDVFAYNGNEATIKSLPTNTVSVSSLSSNFVGSGLQIQGNALTTIVNAYDSSSFNVDVNTLRLQQIISPSTTNFSNVTYNSFGQISAVNTAIFDTLSGNSSNPIFNGTYDQDIYTNQTLLTAISSNPSGGTAVTRLSSAGYMSIDTSIGLVALPIFKYTT